MSRKKFYITTSIAYTNALPHIGFALELVQADVLARYHRLLDEDVFFLTGTDEHGFKIAEAAEKEGKKPEVFVKEVSDKFKELGRVLNISNDDFIRTTDEKRHWPVVREVWKKLEEKGDLYLKDYEGWYCKGCEAFITKRKEEKGNCINHPNIKPELVQEKNYFFKLSKYSEKIRELIKSDRIKIIPEARKNEILSIIDQGIEDISFSRSRKKFKWGIPVPSDEENQTIYVWADALTNYISALGYPESKEFKKYWPADVQCVGKDILKFHSLIWPAMLLSLDLELPKTIFVHGFITANGQKMSKSLGNVIDPFELVKKYGSTRASTELSRMSSPQAGTDAVRYFLLREIPTTEDGDFSYEKFEKRYNADLANGIGNLIARTLTMAENYWRGVIPKNIKNNAETLSLGNINGMYIANFQNEIDIKFNNSLKALANYSFNTSLSEAITAVFICDSYIEQHKLYKSVDFTDKTEKRDAILYNTLEGIRHIAWMLLPLLPKTADNIFEQLGLNPKEEKSKSLEEAIKWGELKAGTKIKKGNSLFPKI